MPSCAVEGALRNAWLRTGQNCSRGACSCKRDDEPHCDQRVQAGNRRAQVESGNQAIRQVYLDAIQRTSPELL